MDFLSKVLCVNSIVKQESRLQANPSSAYFGPGFSCVYRKASKFLLLANFCLSAAYLEIVTCTDDDASCFASVQNKLHV